ncbi:sugar ABC transporter permease [Actinophytocola xinjiangensis]|uniref:Sugar ABC transporter permease n=1 Tax=Actinophytocola xinjiangensis TaxID=485602 RepID=A0A7Z0WH44_9PSEU|nr:sugar ABC transporter permease [Actinophytocola xinjiangensis]OLF07022.1 sugar ABC transporter permease [Actinophytocola xinjiangensis]
MTLGRSRQRFPYWFLVPALVVYGVVVIYPTIAGGVYAFTDWTGSRDGANVTGLANFGAILEDPDAMAALRNTVVLAVAVTIVQTVLGLGLAITLHTRLATRNVLRTLFFLPAVLPPVIIGFLWQYLLTPSGPVNEVLGNLGLGGLAQNWLGDSSVALWSVVGVIVWQNVGLTMIIYLAGLEGIPVELNEAAAIDGAGWWRRLRGVTLPLLMPATTIVVSLTLISSLKVFDQVFVMTGGGPGYATETLSLTMYKEAFVSGQFGYSAAVALVLTMLVAAFALVQLGATRRFEVRT